MTRRKQEADPVQIVVPAGPPTLTAGAETAMLRLLRNAAANRDGNTVFASQPGDEDELQGRRAA